MNDYKWFALVLITGLVVLGATTIFGDDCPDCPECPAVSEAGGSSGEVQTHKPQRWEIRTQDFRFRENRIWDLNLDLDSRHEIPSETLRMIRKITGVESAYGGRLEYTVEVGKLHDRRTVARAIMEAIDPEGMEEHRAENK